MMDPDPLGFSDTSGHLQSLLNRAAVIKQSLSVEQPLPVAEFTGSKGLKSPASESEKTSHYAEIELAARRIFHQYVAANEVHQPEFVGVWNLLDILSICGDQEQCDPVLVWWLIEELLESQKIESCRTVFDYLDSRRERLTTHHFGGKKELVILRAFNELLRRLSRAEDAVFCGRVLIFLSQSFQLGTRSATNHKGVFNVENVTRFEDATSATPEDVEVSDAPPVATESAPEADGNQLKSSSTVEPEISAEKKAVTPATMDSDALYPLFWSLQKAFSNPLLVFDSKRMGEFKKGLDATVRKFKEVPKVIETSNTESVVGVKRSRDEAESADDFASAFNPKYLTSKDLFKLELSDLAFQRDILVQALILIDFLLSLSEKAKKRSVYSQAQNKAVQYNFTLIEQDEEWLSKMKGSIAIYLREGPEGTYFYRMVDTVLSRDKNWVKWKLDNCPDIRRQPASHTNFQKSTDSARESCKPLRLRSAPLGCLDLRFLEDGQIESDVARLKTASRRFPKPNLETLVQQVQTTELDLEMASGEEQGRLTNTKDVQLWGILRNATRDRSAFPRVTKVSKANEIGRLLATSDENGKFADDLSVDRARSEADGREDGVVPTVDATDIQT